MRGWCSGALVQRGVSGARLLLLRMCPPVPRHHPFKVDRVLMWALWERLLGAGVLTADGDEAVRIGKGWERHDIYRYVVHMCKAHVLSRKVRSG